MSKSGRQVAIPGHFGCHHTLADYPRDRHDVVRFDPHYIGQWIEKVGEQIFKEVHSPERIALRPMNLVRMRNHACMFNIGVTALDIKRLTSTYSFRQPRDSVQLLLRLGLLRKSGSTYSQTDSHITTGDEVRDTAVARFHLQNLQLAAEAIDRCTPENRDISCIVAGLSPTGISRLKGEIQQFRQKLIGIINSDKTPACAVYHINFQMYQTSEFHD